MKKIMNHNKICLEIFSLIKKKPLNVAYTNSLNLIHAINKYA